MPNAIFDPDEKRARALMMLLAHIKGAPRKEIAKDFRVSLKTVARTLSWAKRAKLLVEIEDRILEELVPASFNAVMEALKSDTAPAIDKAKIGLEIFKGTIASFSAKKPEPALPALPGEDLASYINQFRTGEGVLDGDFSTLGELTEATDGFPALEAAPTATPASSSPSAEINGVGILRPAGNPQGLGETNDLRADDSPQGD